MGLPGNYIGPMFASILLVDDGPRIVNTIALVLGLVVLYVVGANISNAARQRRRNRDKQDDNRN